jgi:protein TonB
MPHALLLSPDDQAVNAITGVLEEMSVSCERPLDGVSAARKLNSTNFDLVLVDCENLPAAKLIFDVCRRGSNGHSPVPIAIVDGRAGLPTAFRLGAELILTKPVAKDQARSTIRTAVSRVRKDVSANETASLQLASAAAAGASGAQSAVAASSQLTSFADPAPSYLSTSASGTSPASAPNAAFDAALSAPGVPANMNPAVDEAEIEAREFSAASSWPESSSIHSAAAGSNTVRPSTPSDDPVLADLERSEHEESERTPVPMQDWEPGKAADTETRNESSVKSGVAAYSSRHRQQKTRGSLVALLVLLLVGCGFYAAWLYQPGFQAMAQPEIDRMLALAGMALPPTPKSNHTKLPVRLAPPEAPHSAPAATTNSDQTPEPAPESATGSAAVATIAVVTGPTSGAASPSAAAIAPANQTATPAPTVVAPRAVSNAIPAASVNKSESKPNDAGKDAIPSTALLPGEESAVILSSKGAEKRLAYSIAPKYPADALPGKTEGTVVLKAVVDASGKVDGLRLVEGNATLATTAIQAVKQWRYRPYVRDGKTQSFQTIVIVDFQRH